MLHQPTAPYAFRPAAAPRPEDDCGAAALCAAEGDCRALHFRIFLFFFFLQVFLTPSLTNGRIGRRIMWSYTRVTSAGGAANLWLRPESAAFPASTSLRAEVERQEEP